MSLNLRENNLSDEDKNENKKELFEINLPEKKNTENEKTDLIRNDINIIKKDIDKLYDDIDNKMYNKLDNQLNNQLEISSNSINLIVFLIVITLVIFILLLWYFIKNYYYSSQNYNLNNLENNNLNNLNNHHNCNDYNCIHNKMFNSNLVNNLENNNLENNNLENNNLENSKNNYINLDYSGINTKLYDYHNNFPHKNTIFVSSIHEYYPPFTKVIQDGDTNYIPIHNSKKGYFEQMLKFR